MFKNKTILITGGTGSIGSAIARALQGHGVKAVRILSNDEDGIFSLSRELEGEKNRYFVGDIRDIERINMACEGVDIVFHAAALKHVPLSEYNPMDAVKTNVLGTQNVITACMNQKVKKMIFISTDKAVEPGNTMGASKLLAEKLVTNAMFYKGDRTSIFSIVRFGNVIGSRGSVIPLWIDQAQSGKPITLTDPGMTRFMMSIKEAVKLIFSATKIAKGGEIFAFKMPSLRMQDLAEVIAESLGKNKNDAAKLKIVNIGARPGEKQYESLMTDDEAVRAFKLDKLYIIPPVSPEIPGMEYLHYGYRLKKMQDPYRSDRVKPMSKKDILKTLMSLKILN